jgi:hypothetical protein
MGHESVIEAIIKIALDSVRSKPCRERGDLTRGVNDLERLVINRA